MYNLTKTNKSRRNDSTFSVLRKTPIVASSTASGVSKAGVFTMPGNGDLGISFSVPVTLSQLQLLVGAKIISAPALVANQIYKIGFFERAQSIGFKVAIPGTVQIFHIAQNGVVTQIASGVIT